MSMFAETGMILQEMGSSYRMLMFWCAVLSAFLYLLTCEIRVLTQKTRVFLRKHRNKQGGRR